MNRQSFSARVWAKLIRHDKIERLLESGDCVLAAVSGGPDSVWLAYFLSQMARRKNFSLHLAYVDHGLRAAAASEALFVERLAKKLDVPFYRLKAAAALAAAKRGLGKEEAARKTRYAVLARLARKIGANKIATGQHLDDQAETVLLNLLRGTKLQALAAMPPQRPLAPGLTLIRPLLPLKRSEISDALRLHRLPHRLDRSNLSMEPTRNWLRLKIIPMIERRQGRAREHLASIAEQVRRLTNRKAS